MKTYLIPILLDCYKLHTKVVKFERHERKQIHEYYYGDLYSMFNK